MIVSHFVVLNDVVMVVLLLGMLPHSPYVIQDQVDLQGL